MGTITVAGLIVLIFFLLVIISSQESEAQDLQPPIRSDSNQNPIKQSQNRILLTDNKFANVKLVLDDMEMSLRDLSTIDIYFMKNSENPIKHVDYQIIVTKNNIQKFYTEKLHSHDGTFRLPFYFDEEGEYEIEIEISGIYFQPIPKDRVLFKIDNSFKGQSKYLNFMQKSVALSSLETTEAFDSSVIPGSYIVLIKPGEDPQKIASDYSLNIAHKYEHSIYGFSIRNADPAKISQIENDPRVGGVFEDRIMKISAQSIPTGVNRIDADLSSVANIDSVNDLLDVDIAVIDSGTFPHVDINLHKNINCIDGSCVEVNLSTNIDEVDHGTHVSGTAAAIDNNLGVVGVAPGARVWGIKVCDVNGCPVSAIIAGTDFVTANAAEIEVANMSLGGPCFGNPDPIEIALANSKAAGVAYAVAAGNEAQDAGNVCPARATSVLSVSAVADYDGKGGGLGFDGAGNPNQECANTFAPDPDDALAGFSNFGSAVDIAALGVCIRSTLPNDSYGLFTGTSMASPHVAGALALYIAENGRDLNGDLTVDGADVDLVYAAIIANGIPQNDPNGFAGDTDGFAEPLLFVGDTTLSISGTSQIQGTKWSDTNVDGVFDALEPALKGWEIQLFDASFSYITNDFTDVNGNYAFTGLPAVDFNVCEVNQTTNIQTFPANDSCNPVSISQDGQVITGVNFGNALITGDIQGMKWEDTNGDGVFDTGEPKLANWEIVLSGPTEFAITTTDANGDYAFTGVAAGDIVVCETPQPTSHTQTFPPLGCHNVSITTLGQVITGIDFGNTPNQSEIHGLKFRDLDGDGIFDPLGGETLVPGIEIILDNEHTGTLTTITDQNGEFGFMNLPGNSFFRLSEDAVGQTLPTTQDSFDELNLLLGFSSGGGSSLTLDEKYQKGLETIKKDSQENPSLQNSQEPQYSAQVTNPDPVGDSSAPPDITFVTFEYDGVDALILTIEYAQDVSPCGSGGPNTEVCGFIELDADQNLATGFQFFSGVGSDFDITLFDPLDGFVDIRDVNFFSIVESVPISFTSNSFSIVIPHCSLGGGHINYGVNTGDPFGHTDIFPDTGTVATTGTPTCENIPWFIPILNFVEIQTGWDFGNDVFDTSPPAAPTISGPPSGIVTNDNTVTIAGDAETLSTVEIFDGSTSLGTTTATSPWTFTTPALSDGTHTITATAKDIAGNTSPASASVTVTVDSSSTCLPPSSGDWTIPSSCTLTSSTIAPRSVIVQNNSVLTIPAGLTLTIDFSQFNLTVEFESGVRIKAGGTISSPSVEFGI